MSEQRRWIVTTSADRAFAEVVDELARAGLTIEEGLDGIGVVVGRCDPETAERLRNLSGVADVASEVPVDIGPPETPETW